MKVEDFKEFCDDWKKENQIDYPYIYKCPFCKEMLEYRDLHVEDGFGICPYCENEFEVENE